ncbi:30S ribosomal protein S9 [Patescibacteria group bacterium]|nr:30S ribosomal protein S9 [Patescibacteria group bacterium]MCG2702424.1 30S ribosomal protein S9 [Candidatus Parcubacteria bacterium]MBU4264526.1 30S ribosomal protein S9 [Patescibacteria group bacterium]MBU4390457.1 30S ribosomal protein S9 [Patescibacteria group bacterium]MBU4397373.1 30S ribosomal protein S9 [Patescibacteria group bacterium]
MKKYIYAIGRRRSAIVTVKLFKGKEESLVNNISVSKYFPSPHQKIKYQKPFVLTSLLGKYFFQAKASGGGKEGQLDALALAISRALERQNPDLRDPLKKAKLLRVDSRIRQRRRVGKGGKARRGKQSPRR